MAGGTDHCTYSRILGGDRVRSDWLAWSLYALGVIAASSAGFFSPCWFLGFVPLSVGLVYAALDLVPEVPDESPTPTQRPFV